MTASLGASSCNSPSCLAAKSPTVWTTPVTLPPGRLRLTTKPVLTGSKTGGEDDRDRRSGRFGDRRRKSVGHDHSDVLPLDKSGLVQALPECANQVLGAGRRRGAEKADHWHHRLLRPRRERPRGRRAAEQRDERAPSHSITSSARPTSG